MLRLILPLLFLAIQSALVISWDEHICTQPIQKGHCLAYLERYAFNTTSGKCEQFIFGGCGGNKNNFENLYDCHKLCSNDCLLPMKVGPCKMSLPRYYYDKETKSCEEFIYGGCKGNANNFKSKKDCEADCVNKNTPE